jgi:hypothetical protein
MTKLFNDEKMDVIYESAMYGLTEHFDDIARYLDIDDNELEKIKQKLFKYLSG